MANVRTQQERTKIERLLGYMLTRRPDEFGLVPEGGSYRLKDVLKALAEEGRVVREGQIREMNLLAVAENQNQPFIIEENRIRPGSGKAPEPVETMDVPGQLYSSCRRKAHPIVQEHGLQPASGPWVVLTAKAELALRIGRRRDPDPVPITVEAQKALSSGIQFWRLLDEVYLCRELPAHLVHIPALPKEKPDKTAPVKPVSGPHLPPADRLPGSFELRFDKSDLGGDTWDRADRYRSKEDDRPRKKKEWQKDRRRQRRQKDDWS